jgi:hypothetical protein
LKQMHKWSLMPWSHSSFIYTFAIREKKDKTKREYKNRNKTRGTETSLYEGNIKSVCKSSFHSHCTGELSQYLVIWSANGEVFCIKHVMKFVNHVWWVLPTIPVFSTNNTDITVILLKVAQKKIKKRRNKTRI